MKNKGFTLLELVVVIIIIGVLASLALPRLFRVIEYSRSAEAVTMISSVRRDMDRCRLMNNDVCGGCAWTVKTIANPNAVPGSHFTYYMSHVNNTFGLYPCTYSVIATRNTLDRGDGTSRIKFVHQDDHADKNIYWYGDGVFENITTGPASSPYAFH